MLTALIKSLLYKGGGTQKRLKIFFPYLIGLSSHVYDIFRSHELPAQLEVQIFFNSAHHVRLSQLTYVRASDDSFELLLQYGPVAGRSHSSCVPF